MPSTLSKQRPSKAPSGAVAYTAAADGDKYLNGGKEWVHVKNAGGSPITVTVNPVVPCNFGVTHALTVSVPAGSDRAIGPLEPDLYNDASGFVTLHYSAVTSVTAALFST